MKPEIEVRRGRMKDAQTIADFVNKARPSATPVTRTDVAERYSQVGFLLAEYNQQLVGLVGWQVENLVIRVTDFLIAPAVDRVVAGRVLISAMEEEGRQLQCEAAILFLPPNPSADLISYWETFSYEKRAVATLPKVWRDAVTEIRINTQSVMVKQLREDLVRKPM